MANEIIGVVKRTPDKASMIYLFPISPRIVDGGGAEVVPAFDPAAIPDRFAGQLSAGQRNALANGDAGYTFRELERQEGETDPAFAARVKADYVGVTAVALQAARDAAVESGDFDLRRFKLDA